MLYKGDGLELRTPPGGGGPRGGGAGLANGWLARALETPDDEAPVLVDDLVMRCFNQAYDLAVAHRAPEVGLEHLIHALTLDEAAAAILHEYSFHVSTLRRESASIIAGEPPVGRTAGPVSPRPSGELLEILQAAAERAYSQRAPVTTEALLDTLLDMKRELSSRNLLSRHRHDWDLRAASEPRERVRVSAGSNPMGGAARTEAVPTTTDTVQNTRIDALERAVRELSEDLAVNRKTFASLVDELRDARSSGGGVRGEGLYVGNGSAQNYPEPTVESLDLDHDHIIDRLYLLERNVESKFGELARTWSLLGQRLEAMERALDERPADGGGLPEDVGNQLAGLPGRLVGLERQLTAKIDERLARIDERLSDTGIFEDAIPAALRSLPERISVMERRLLDSANAPKAFGMPAELNGKLDKIDQAFAALIIRLDELEERFESPVDGNWDMAPLSAGLRDIEVKAGDTQLMIDGVDDRLKKVEDLLDAHRAQVAQMSSTLGTEVRALASAVSAQGVGGERMNSLIQDGMRGVAQTFEQQKGEIADAVARELSDRIAHLSATLQAKQSEQGQILSAPLPGGSRTCRRHPVRGSQMTVW